MKSCLNRNKYNYIFFDFFLSFTLDFESIFIKSCKVTPSREQSREYCISTDSCFFLWFHLKKKITLAMVEQNYSTQRAAFFFHNLKKGFPVGIYLLRTSFGYYPSEIYDLPNSVFFGGGWAETDV